MLGLLFVHWNMNPEIFRIGGFAVRWYGVLFVSGFILGYWMFTKFCQKERVDTKMLDPLLFTAFSISQNIILALGRASSKYSRSGKAAWQAMAVL